MEHPPNTPPRSPDLEDSTVVGLLRHLMDETALLFRQELALVVAQLTLLAGKLTTGVVSAALGGAVLFAGFLVLLASAVLGLALVLAPWLAALVVGLIVTVLGIVMVAMGYKAMHWAELRLPRSQQSLRKDKDVLARSMP